MNGDLLALGAVAALAVGGLVRRKGGSRGQGFRFSGDTCPGSTQDVVEWSTENWWYPTPVQEIEWPAFRAATVITPDMITEWLGWSVDWMPFDEWLAGEPGAGTHAWFAGTLPSGQPFYVWVGSGIEHWWTLDGAGVDTQYEQALIDSLYDRLELLDEAGHNVTLADTKRELAQIIAGGSIER
jgi:hypothetical protein